MKFLGLPDLRISWGPSKPVGLCYPCGTRESAPFGKMPLEDNWEPPGADSGAVAQNGRVSPLLPALWKTAAGDPPN